jgi:hypothetical protein
MKHNVEIIEWDLETYTMSFQHEINIMKKGVWNALYRARPHGKVINYILKYNIQSSTPINYLNVLLLIYYTNPTTVRA